MAEFILQYNDVRHLHEIKGLALAVRKIVHEYGAVCGQFAQIRHSSKEFWLRIPDSEAVVDTIVTSWAIFEFNYDLFVFNFNWKINLYSIIFLSS